MMNTSSDHEVARRKLAGEIDNADALLSAHVDDGEIKVMCSVNRDQFEGEDLDTVLDALMFAIQHPEDPLSLDEVDRIVGKTTEDP